MEKIAEHIEYPVSRCDVDTVYRINTTIENKPKPIIIKFLSQYKGDAILAAKIKRKNSENTEIKGIAIENISNNMFINEHLTPNMKAILKQAKDVAKIKKYKFVWVKNGCVYARKNETSRVIKLTSMDDINRFQ